MKTINWKSVCRQYGITPDQLAAIAADLYLPQKKLNILESKQLLQRVQMLHGNVLEEWSEETY